MYLLLRIVRAIFGFIFALQVIGLLPILTLISTPDEFTGKLLAVVTVKLVALLISGAVFFYGRFGINALHKKFKGEPHPSLNSTWSL